MVIKPQETIPCKMCGVPTEMLATELCDSCWELQRNPKPRMTRDEFADLTHIVTVAFNEEVAGPSELLDQWMDKEAQRHGFDNWELAYDALSAREGTSCEK